jgi:hypothetical protein
VQLDCECLKPLVQLVDPLVEVNAHRRPEHRAAAGPGQPCRPGPTLRVSPEPEDVSGFDVRVGGHRLTARDKGGAP